MVVAAPIIDTYSEDVKRLIANRLDITDEIFLRFINDQIEFYTDMIGDTAAFSETVTEEEERQLTKKIITFSKSRGFWVSFKNFLVEINEGYNPKFQQPEIDEG